MNGRNFLVFSRSFLCVWMQLWGGVAFSYGDVPWIEPAGIRGRPGQATGQGAFNFTELEQQEVPPATAPLASRPALRRSQVPRGALPAGVPRTATQPPAALPAPGGEIEFAAASTAVPSPALSGSFLALTDDATAFNPDTQGAVGPNHLVATLASQVRVQDRFGGPIQTMSLRTFWGVSDPTNVYDPRILYDRAAQRWIATAIANPGADNSSLLLAVSQTSDPTSGWYRRSVRTDLNDPVFPDSPNVGLTRDWITVTANMYHKTNYSYFSCDIWVFNKSDLYAGGAGQFTFFRYLQARLAEASVLVPSVNEDNATTNILVSNFDGNVETEEGSFGFFRLFSITGPVGAETFNDFAGPGGTNGNYAGLFVPWDSFSPTFDNFASQKGSPDKIYIGDARVQNAVYRNGFLWFCQHVFFPAGNPQRTALQWLSVTPGGEVDQVGYLEDPAGIKSYAYPSLAVNTDGDVLIGFSSFSAQQYPTAGYAFHAYQDGSGALRQEDVLKAGEASFFVSDEGVNHWGDWSATVVDPQNDTDLWTLQEYASAHVGTDSRWGTWWGRVSPQADLAIAQTATPSAVPAGAPVTYSIFVTNMGFTTATGARLTDTLPGGAVFVSATTAAGSCGHTNGVVVCNLGHLAASASASVTIVAQLTQAGSTNTVVASGFGAEDTPADNTARLITTVNPAADLTLALSANSNPVTVSNLLTYTLRVTNRGPSQAMTVTATDILPAGVTFLSASTAQGTCAQNNGVVTCNLGGLGAGADQVVTIQVRPNTNGSLTNRVSVTSPVPDPVQNNAVTNITQVNSAPSMQAISDRTINEDSVLDPIEFSVSDAETPAENLILIGSSSNPAVVPSDNIVFGGSGSLRTISVIPLAQANGTIFITRTLIDPDGGSNSLSFRLTIVPVNDPPTIGHIADQTIGENQTAGPLTFNVRDVETRTTVLNVSAASSNPALLPNANISLEGAGPTRTVTARPATNQFGTATITLTVSDGSAATSDSFLLTVVAADPPNLQIRLADSIQNMVLSWPASSGTAWFLQSSTSLGSIASWNKVGADPVMMADQYTVTVPRSAANAFFRLGR